MNKMGKTYLITGGSGFVGYNMLSLVASSFSDDVDHVKVIDLRFPLDLIEHIESKAKGVTFEWIEGDITCQDVVTDAANECDAVLHIAGITPISLVYDEETMWKVNVTGTENVVNACLQTRVTQLVYVSSYTVVGPNRNADPGLDLEEDSSYNIHPMTWYGQTKKKGESIVLDANGRKNKDGKVLTTCALRPPALYGEDFPLLLSNYNSWSAFGKVVSITKRDAKTSHIYVGNLSSAILLAAKKMKEKSGLVGGQAYFVKDYTPDQQYYRVVGAVYEAVGMPLDDRRMPFIPVWIMFLLYIFLEFVNDVIGYFGLTKWKLVHHQYVWNMNTQFTISDRKFRTHFGYQPLYSYEAAIENTRRFLKRMKAENFQKRIYN